MKNYIRPSEFYEWTINNIDNFSLEEQERTFKNLKDLNWIPTMIKGLNPFQRAVFKLTMLNKLDDKEMPFCLMSLSCILYNLRLNGLDVTGLEQAINTSERVFEEIKKMFNKEYL